MQNKRKIKNKAKGHTSSSGKKIISSIVAVLILTFYSFNISNNSKLDELANEYVESHNELAVIEMYRTGVPASITLAQALHESNYGQSRLASEAKNHFGIKCKAYWTGETFYHKDDDFDNKGNLINSCFRKYDMVLFSYIDHSNFLVERKNYASLFDYDNTDYESWAYGLKRCGYATDPNYAEKLINIVLRYNLNQYDFSENPMDVAK
jgi:flagellum-specific peptidoglycan hydrolase FlgJ